jgi:quinol monooxygenase YgiN
MSVIVTIAVNADPDKFEAVAQANADRIKKVMGRAVDNGLIGHRFYGADGGRIVAIDEWPDAESFQAFFGSVGEDVGFLMGEVGASSEPEVTFWRKLDTGDDHGWD